MSNDSFNTLTQLTINQQTYHYYCIPKAARSGLGRLSHLPRSLKVLLENILRHEDGKSVTKDDVYAFSDWLDKKSSDKEIAYRPARVLMQDFTGVPAVVDLAAMRDAVVNMKGNANKINPQIPVDLIIDHSVQVDKYGSPNAYQLNTEIEIKRNHERYQFLKWGQSTFDNFRVVPPGTGICHQVNLEYLAKVAWTRKIGDQLFVFPDTLVGTDSHTTMINGLGVLGWGVGGIEAEAAMLGQPITMLIPEVMGFQLTGKLKEGVTATDLVLTVTQMLRQKNVVGKFVEFFGPGLDDLPLADRATISNMSPEYGATCGFFPIDDETLSYLQLTGRDADTIALVEAYAKAQGLWREDGSNDPEFTDTISLDLASVKPSVAGPKRPQDKVLVTDLKQTTETILSNADKQDATPVKTDDFELSDGDVVIAAITSCTNTSNPSVMLAAGLLAKKALEKGLKRKPWVKSSLAPGSKVVTDYLTKTDLQQYLDQLGFNLVGYGCTTCIGNSGPLPEAISKAITDNNMVVSAVLSGNRNFEGRVHPLTKANWLASPPLVVAYALAGTTRINLDKDPIGNDDQGNPVMLTDIWPSSSEIASAVKQVAESMFTKEYAEVFDGDEAWRAIQISGGETYDWNGKSTYIQNPPFFTDLTATVAKANDVSGASVLALLGDSITTDHISPAGAIKADSPAGKYLIDHGVKQADFNSYGSRRGNHEVMMRGTFANIRIRNEMTPDVEGGFTKYIPDGETVSIYDAAMKYQTNKIPLVVVAGKEYGTGSSRDWAAKGTRLLGIKAVIAESFERIHRSNLIGMGVLPLRFENAVTRKTLKLTGDETFDIKDIATIQPKSYISAVIHYSNGDSKTIQLLVRIDTKDELEYYVNGGILHYVLRQLHS